MFTTLDHSFMRRERPGPIGLSLSLGPFGIPRLIRTRPFTSLWRDLDRYFHDPRLKQLFGRYATYCGSSPFSAPATLALIAHAERAGVWLVDGGMQRLADALAALLEETGATIHYDAEAAGFLRKGERVTGVVLADGSAMSADAIVFNGDVAAISRGMLGAEFASAVPARKREPRSLSAVTWCFRGRIEGFPLDHHTVLFGNDYAAEFEDIFEHGRVPDRPTVYICAQDRGHGRGAVEAGRERLFMLVNAPPKPMSDDELGRVVDDTFAQLDSHGLRFHDVDSAVTNRPDDFDERFPGSDGAIYGWPTHGWSGSFRRGGSRSRMQGLYLAGGTVHPGPGVPMTAISGRLAATSVLKDLRIRR
jgi:1-hydroxycarotenoid 3,4-desaturase